MIGSIGTSSTITITINLQLNPSSLTAEASLHSASRSATDYKQVKVSRSHIATDDQSVGWSWCRAPSGAHDEVFTVLQLRSCFCGAPSLTRWRVCLLYMLLVLASAVFLGSESHGTRDHILLSQIWDFPFRHLLRLAGLRWRYSTPPPHGLGYKLPSLFPIKSLHGPRTENTLRTPSHRKHVCVDQQRIFSVVDQAFSPIYIA
jgi:hypothetical protein